MCITTFVFFILMIFFSRSSEATNAKVQSAGDAAKTQVNNDRRSSSSARHPNVVIFIADDLGIGDIGCFGNDTMRTPNIDRIARDGAKLTHNLAAEALCTPSRAALMTARYPIRSGMAASHRVRVFMHNAVMGGLPPNETTFAEEAKRLGYATALIGKWHLGIHCSLDNLYCHHPLKQGFDYYYGVPLTNARDLGSDWRKSHIAAFPQSNTLLLSVALGGLTFILVLRRLELLGIIGTTIMFLLIVFPPSYVYFFLNSAKLLNSMIMRNYENVQQPISFENLTQNLVTEGKKFLQAQDPDKSFLLVMSWIQVHTVLHASKRFQGRSNHGAYGDNVEEMDWSVGEIMTELEKLGFLDDTFIYFTSDNGGHTEERDEEGNSEGGWNGIYRGGKAQGAMDGGIRMPTVAMWKGHIKPNTLINVPTSQMDILPTLLSVWGEPLPSGRVLDGKNIYPLLTGKVTSSPHRFLMHYCGSEIHAARYIPENVDIDVYKVYYATPKWLPGTYTCDFLCTCDERGIDRHSTPLMYNIGRDPSEEQSLPVHEPRFRKILELVNDAVKEHKEKVESVPDQFALGRLLPLPWLLHCCNFPYCSCMDPVYYMPRS